MLGLYDNASASLPRDGESGYAGTYHSPLRPSVTYVSQVKKWYDAGLVTSKLTSSTNGIALCPTCHARFNNLNDPGYLFYPEDLDFFIEFGLHDQLLREESPRPRNVPIAKEYKLQQIRQRKVSADDIGGLYQPVFF